MGKYGIRIMKSKGEKLIDFCGMNNLIIIVIIFFFKDIYKNIWILFDGKLKYIIR